MRQVPHYLIIGNGRVSRHFQHYFSLLSVSFETWNRHESLAKLNSQLTEASHVLLLISDGVIDEFIAEHLSQSKALSIHFSGSLVSQLAHGAHPLMTFSNELYDLAQYQSIPFILDQDAPAFDELLPGIPNQHVRLEKSLKAKYHALCVMSGNFSCMLWQKLFHSLEHEFNFPSTLAHPYLTQQMHNLIYNTQSALTGPLVRGDMSTIEKNLTALHADPFQDVYQSFVSCFQKMHGEK